MDEPIGGIAAEPVVQRTDVDVLYNVMTSVENRIGGGEGIEGIYGTLTQTGCQKVMDAMHDLCGLDHSSVLVDIGAGLGRPLVHALFSPGVRKAYGVEVDAVKCAKAKVFCQQTLLEMAQRQRVGQEWQTPEIVEGNIEKATTLDPCTHAFSFWEGIPVSARQAFGRLFFKSSTLQAVVVIQRSLRKEDPEDIMKDYGFGPLKLRTTFPVKMSGRGAQFQAYIFCRQSYQPPSRLPPADAADAEASCCSDLSEQSAIQPGTAAVCHQDKLPSCAESPEGTVRPFFNSPLRKPSHTTAATDADHGVSVWRSTRHAARVLVKKDEGGSKVSSGKDAANGSKPMKAKGAHHHASSMTEGAARGTKAAKSKALHHPATTATQGGPHTYVQTTLTERYRVTRSRASHLPAADVTKRDSAVTKAEIPLAMRSMRPAAHHAALKLRGFGLAASMGGSKDEREEAGVMPDKQRESKAGVVQEDAGESKNGLMQEEMGESKAGTVKEQPTESKAGVVEEKPRESKAWVVEDKPREVKAGMGKLAAGQQHVNVKPPPTGKENHTRAKGDLVKGHVQENGGGKKRRRGEDTQGRESTGGGELWWQQEAKMMLTRGQLKKVGIFDFAVEAAQDVGTLHLRKKKKSEGSPADGKVASPKNAHPLVQLAPAQGEDEGGHAGERGRVPGGHAHQHQGGVGGGPLAEQAQEEQTEAGGKEGVEQGQAAQARLGLRVQAERGLKQEVGLRVRRQAEQVQEEQAVSEVRGHAEHGQEEQAGLGVRGQAEQGQEEQARLGRREQAAEGQSESGGVGIKGQAEPAHGKQRHEQAADKSMAAHLGNSTCVDVNVDEGGRDKGCVLLKTTQDCSRREKEEVASKDTPEGSLQVRGQGAEEGCTKMGLAVHLTSPHDCSALMTVSAPAQATGGDADDVEAALFCDEVSLESPRDCRDALKHDGSGDAHAGQPGTHIGPSPPAPTPSVGDTQKGRTSAGGREDVEMDVCELLCDELPFSMDGAAVAACGAQGDAAARATALDALAAAADHTDSLLDSSDSHQHSCHMYELNAATSSFLDSGAAVPCVEGPSPKRRSLKEKRDGLKSAGLSMRHRRRGTATAAGREWATTGLDGALGESATEELHPVEAAAASALMELTSAGHAALGKLQKLHSLTMVETHPEEGVDGKDAQVMAYCPAEGSPSTVASQTVLPLFKASSLWAVHTQLAAMRQQGNQNAHLNKDSKLQLRGLFRKMERTLPLARQEEMSVPTSWKSDLPMTVEEALSPGYKQSTDRTPAEQEHAQIDAQWKSDLLASVEDILGQPALKLDVRPAPVAERLGVPLSGKPGIDDVVKQPRVQRADGVRSWMEPTYSGGSILTLVGEYKQQQMERERAGHDKIRTAALRQQTAERSGGQVGEMSLFEVPGKQRRCSVVDAAVAAGVRAKPESHLSPTLYTTAADGMISPCTDRRSSPPTGKLAAAPPAGKLASAAAPPAGKLLSAPLNMKRKKPTQLNTKPAPEAGGSLPQCPADSVLPPAPALDVSPPPQDDKAPCLPEGDGAGKMLELNPVLGALCKLTNLAPMQLLLVLAARASTSARPAVFAALSHLLASGAEKPAADLAQTSTSSGSLPTSHITPSSSAACALTVPTSSPTSPVPSPTTYATSATMQTTSPITHASSPGSYSTSPSSHTTSFNITATPSAADVSKLASQISSLQEKHQTNLQPIDRTIVTRFLHHHLLSASSMYDGTITTGIQGAPAVHQVTTGAYGTAPAFSRSHSIDRSMSASHKVPASLMLALQQSLSEEDAKLLEQQDAADGGSRAGPKPKVSSGSKRKRLTTSTKKPSGQKQKRQKGQQSPTKSLSTLDVNLLSPASIGQDDASAYENETFEDAEPRFEAAIRCIPDPRQNHYPPAKPPTTAPPAACPTAIKPTTSPQAAAAALVENSDKVSMHSSNTINNNGPPIPESNTVKNDGSCIQENDEMEDDVLHPYDGENATVGCNEDGTARLATISTKSSARGSTVRCSARVGHLARMALEGGHRDNSQGGQSLPVSTMRQEEVHTQPSTTEVPTKPSSTQRLIPASTEHSAEPPITTNLAANTVPTDMIAQAISA